MLRRRDLLGGAALIIACRTIGGAQALSLAPWRPNAGDPPPPFHAGPWLFFTTDEGRAVEAIADRLIPPDPDTPGGKDAGCALFLDRQLAGPYGASEGLYMSGPFQKGMKNQGPQDGATPAQTYRRALSALDAWSRKQPGGKPFAELDDAGKDHALSGLESGEVKLDGVDGPAFFEMALKDIQEGFFADPIYGGNRDMCSWRMIGFPGARYDYRDWVGRHNERYPLPPMSIEGRAAWSPGKT